MAVTMKTIRVVTPEERSAAVRQAVSRGRRVKITPGQGKAIASALTGRRVVKNATTGRWSS